MKSLLVAHVASCAADCDFPPGVVHWTLVRLEEGRPVARVCTLTLALVVANVSDAYAADAHVIVL